VFENTVARDGIEPPTPAFSGLRSAAFMLFMGLNVSLSSNPALGDEHLLYIDLRGDHTS
jgi:hypothetical protein